MQQKESHLLANTLQKGRKSYNYLLKQFLSENILE